MNKIAFAKMVDDAYSECKNEEEITSRMEWMLDCIKIQAKFGAGYLKTGTNRVLTHEDICRIAADLSYEEHMEQTNNTANELINCPYYNTEKI